MNFIGTLLFLCIVSASVRADPKKEKHREEMSKQKEWISGGEVEISTEI